MALERIDAYFNSISETYDKRMQRPMTDEDGYIVRTAAVFPQRENVQLLDLGCGTGLELLPLLQREDGLRVTAIDCSEQMLDKLRVNLADYMDRVQPITADFLTADFGVERYDGALAVMALHYYTHEQKLALFRRVRLSLKHNGFFILTDRFAPVQGYEDFCRSELEEKRKAAHQPEGNYHYFAPLTVANEAAILFRAGFSQVQVCWAKSNTAVIVAMK